MTGWNLVPWYGPPTPVAAAFAAIIESIDAAFAWDAPGQRFDGFLPALPAALNALDTLTPGMALWVLVGGAVSVDWVQPDAPLPDRVELAAGFNLVTWGGAGGVAIADGLGQILGLVGSVAAWDAPGRPSGASRRNSPSSSTPCGSSGTGSRSGSRWRRP